MGLNGGGGYLKNKINGMCICINIIYILNVI